MPLQTNGAAFLSAAVITGLVTYILGDAMGLHII